MLLVLSTPSSKADVRPDCSYVGVIKNGKIAIAVKTKAKTISCPSHHSKRLIRPWKLNKKFIDKTPLLDW